MKMMQLIETNRMVPISQFCKKCRLRVSAFGRQAEEEAGAEAEQGRGKSRGRGRTGQGLDQGQRLDRDRAGTEGRYTETESAPLGT